MYMPERGIEMAQMSMMDNTNIGVFIKRKKDLGKSVTQSNYLHYKTNIGRHLDGSLKQIVRPIVLK